MNINDLLQINTQRAARWHNGDIAEWSPLEWAGAMAGEAGEAANAAKKLKRLEGGLASINEPGRHFDTTRAAAEKVVEEIADTILYGVVLAARVGVTDLESVIRRVFNRKSEEYGFPERL